MLSELSTEPITVGGNGYTIKIGDHVRLLAENGRLALTEWIVTGIRLVIPEAPYDEYTLLDVSTTDPAEQPPVDEIHPTWAFPVGTPFWRI